MSTEEAPINNPLHALDALAAVSQRPSERLEPRLAAIGDASPFARAPRPTPPRPTTSPGDRLESAMSEFVRRQVKPEAVPELADLKREGSRRGLIAGAIGLAAVVAVASVVALVFVVFPKRDAVQSFAAGAASASRQADDASQPALSQFRALVAPNGGGQGFTHEQSERLLQQFVQWRQNLALTAKP
jgi:hypothetical protein